MTGQKDGSTADVYYDGVLPGVEKPSRYIDCELNLASDGYEEGSFNVLLVFPDVYEIGMSHQGIRFLYDRLARAGVPVEFAFAPWPDMEKRLRAAGETLRSWQSGRELSDFDLIGFTLPYELHYTNMLTILDLAGLELEADSRNEDDPIVIAGGPCASNPLPILKALDAVFLGDGEESLIEAVEILTRIRKEKGSRSSLRKALADIDGVYARGVSESAEARTYRLKDGDFPLNPIVPSASIVHERLSIEVLRGCTRGCRFCHAGMTYRPRRERSTDSLVEVICSGLDNSGWEDVSLLSLSTSDYSRFDELMEKIQPEIEKRMVSLALPSLRPETVTERIVDATSLGRKSGFTIAPEAGTERLRKVINKCMTDDEIIRGCERILDAGWQTLKLYFMIGLPTETKEDLDGIARLVGRIMEIPRKRGRFKLSVSISPFVPRVQTPFQWERQDTLEETREKESYLARMIRHPRIQLSLRQPEVSAIEGIFARGTEDLWPVVVDAWRGGCRFDGWRDQLDYGLWMKVLVDHGFVVDDLLSGFSTEGELPWERFRMKTSRSFLLREREKAFALEPTHDCRTGQCHGCGACNEEDMKTRAGNGPGTDERNRENQSGGERVEEQTGESGDGPHESGSEPAGKNGVENAGGPERYRYRIIYEKLGRIRFISHRELINVVQRALRRSGLDLSYSEGFHPHARMSMGPSLPVGVEGDEEFFDIELTSTPAISPVTFEGLFPEGMRVTGCIGPFPKSAGRLPEEAVYTYILDFTSLALAISAPYEQETAEIVVKNDFRGVKWYSLGKELERAGGRFGESQDDREDPARFAASAWNSIFGPGGVITDRRGRERSCEGCSLSFSAHSRHIEMRLPSPGRPGPKDLLAAIMPDPLAELVRIRRKVIEFRRDDRFVRPIDLIEEEI